MTAPQIIMLLLLGGDIGMYTIMHGKPKTGTWNMFSGITATGIAIAILWWGGFWS